MELSQNKLDALAREYTLYANETITIEQIGDTVYSFGSEMASLRLFHKFNMCGHCKDSKCAYSKSKESWYFSLRLGN